MAHGLGLEEDKGAGRGCLHRVCQEEGVVAGGEMGCEFMEGIGKGTRGLETRHWIGAACK